MLIFYLFIFLYSLLYVYSSQKEKLVPTTILSASLFVHTNENSKTLHILFIKGKFSHSKKSLQYFFLDEFILTHTKLPYTESILQNGELIPFKALLESITGQEKLLQKLNHFSNVETQPVIFEVSNVKSGVGDSRAQQANIEKKSIINVFDNYSYHYGSFFVYGNHFSVDKHNWFSSVKDVHSKQNYFRMFVERSPSFIDDPRAKTGPIKLCGFAMLNKEMVPFINEEHTFYKFNFAKYNNEWFHIKNGTTCYDYYIKDIFEDNKDNTVNEVVYYFDKIFTRKSHNSIQKYKPTTNFIQTSFFDNIYYIIEGNKNFNLYYNIISANSNKKSGDFEVMDFYYFKDKTKGRYKINVKLKQSFTQDILETSLDPFPIELMKETDNEKHTKHKLPENEDSDYDDDEKDNETNDDGNNEVTEDNTKSEKMWIINTVFTCIVLIALFTIVLLWYCHFHMVNNNPHKQQRNK